MRPIDRALAWTKARRWNQRQLADALGVSSANITNWKKRGLPPEQHQAIADVFSRSVDELLGRARPVDATVAVDSGLEASVQLGSVIAGATRDVPVVGEVKAGPDGYLEELGYPVGHGEKIITWPTKDGNTYALRVRGDSMQPRYRPGDYVIVEPNTPAENGDTVLVKLRDGRKLLKELLYRRDGAVTLGSINDNYPKMTIPDVEIEPHGIQCVTGMVTARSVAIRER